MSYIQVIWKTARDDGFKGVIVFIVGIAQPCTVVVPFFIDQKFQAPDIITADFTIKLILVLKPLTLIAFSQKKRGGRWDCLQ